MKSESRESVSREAIRELNELLQVELSAADTYSEVLPRIADDQVVPVLKACLHSHSKRALKLRAKIQSLGGNPESDGGVWDKFASHFAAGASKLGELPAVTLLEEGEDLALSNYEWKLVRMHGDHRNLVKDELFPEQQETKEKVSELLNALTGGVWPPRPPRKEV